VTFECLGPAIKLGPDLSFIVIGISVYSVGTLGLVTGYNLPAAISFCPNIRETIRAT
jgi:hypothetical protein